MILYNNNNNNNNNDNIPIQRADFCEGLGNRELESLLANCC